ncbi:MULTISPECIES: hypothetical protein [Pseudomonas]|uniref:hypothetical protein n=1 Tax=Pseudomonas TaxID=286 RepID=UPI000BA4A60D|nr:MULTISPECIES: hypothetical protein [Pseudomonas]NVZ72578.1 hypothetical protein [Pseudomonas costantinii]
MAISLIRSLTASVIRNVSALKRDAKRLQKHSQLVFGTEYPLKVCQHAVAVSRGFRSLADVENLAHRLGMDKEAPFWTILGRNDTHQDVLNALYRLNLEYTENGPVVFTGGQIHSVLPALVLFLEQMSLKKLPGLILVETEAPSIQDTFIFDGIKKLGVEEVLEGFRSLDLRDRNLPVSLSTEARWWAKAITDVLPKDLQTALQQSGWEAGLEVSAYENAKSRNQVHNSKDFEAIPFYSVKEAAFQLALGKSWPLWISEDAARQTSAIGACPPELHKESKDIVLDLIKALDSRNFGLGVSSEHESRWRPYVVLFSRNDPASEVLAGVVRSYFSWRQSRDQRSPVLYVSDGATPYAPRFLCFGEHTAVVNGLDSIPVGDGPGEFFGYKNALKVVGTPDGLQYMGKRVPLV